MTKPKRIFIVSDGTALGTRLLDENCNPLEIGNIQSIEWRVDADSKVPIATVVTQFIGAAVDLAVSDG